MTPDAQALYRDLRHDVFRVCVFVAGNALLANFLPAAERLRRWPYVHLAYCLMVDLVAGFALNWRACLPSLEQEFMGFRRRIRHGYRNWRQTRMDRRFGRRRH